MAVVKDIENFSKLHLGFDKQLGKKIILLQRVISYKPLGGKG